MNIITIAILSLFWTMYFLWLYNRYSHVSQIRFARAVSEIIIRKYHEWEALNEASIETHITTCIIMLFPKYKPRKYAEEKYRIVLHFSYNKKSIDKITILKVHHHKVDEEVTRLGYDIIFKGNFDKDFNFKFNNLFDNIIDDRKQSEKLVKELKKFSNLLYYGFLDDYRLWVKDLTTDQLNHAIENANNKFNEIRRFMKENKVSKASAKDTKMKGDI